MVIGATDVLIPASVPGFSDSDLFECEAAIWLSSSFCSYVIIRQKDRKILSIGYMHSSAEESDSVLSVDRFFSAIPWRLSKARKARVALMDGCGFWAPSRIASDKSEAEAMFRLQYGPDYSEIKRWEADGGRTLVYSLPEGSEKQVHDAIPQADILPAIAFVSKFPSAEIPEIRVITSPRRLVLMVRSGAELLYANSFDIKAESDALYHIANVIRQKQLPAHSMQVILSGLTHTSGELFKQLSRYYNEVSWDEGNPAVLWGSDFGDVRKHYFAPLTWM